MSTVQRFFATATVASLLMSAALPVGAQTASELQAQIDALMATLNALQGQVQTAQGGTPSAGAPTACSGISFSRNLTVGSSGTDVKCLQALLNQSADTQVAASGVGSSGSETTYFGSKTRAAAIKFQEKYASEVLTPIGLTQGTGFVGAKTRAKLSAMLTAPVAAAPAPAPAPAPTPGATPTPAPAPAPGSFSVMAAPDNPAATTLGVSSAYNTVLKVKVQAGSSAVDVTSVTVERAGLSIDTHIAGVLVVDEQGMRHGNVVTLADNKVTIPFTGDPIKVAANGSATLSIQVHRSTTGTSGTMQVNLIGMSGSPTGLPVKGNLHTLSDTAGVLGGLTMDVVSQTTVTVNVDIGQTNHILTKFRFAANANEDVKISRLTVFQNGTAADEDLVDWELVDPNGNVLATVAKAVNKVVDFKLATPYTLVKGTNRDLTVRVDVASGSSRTGQVIIQNDYDVVAMGVATGLGILATAAGTVDTAIPIGDRLTGTAGFNHLTVTAGTLTLAKAAGSPSGTFGIGAANVTLATWNLEAKGEDIQIQRADLNISGTTIGSDFTGTVKLMTDAGQVLYSAASTTAALTDDDTNAAGANVVTLSTYYTIPAGTTLKLKVVADASTTIADGDTAIGRISDIYFKRMTSSTFGTASAAAFVAGNTLTASIATLTVVNNAALGNVTVIEGGSDVLIGSYLLQTSSSEGVNVSSIKLDITFGGEAAIGALSNLKLKRADTGAQIGSTTATPAAENTITVSGQLNIPASTTVQVDAYVSMSTAASDGGTNDTVTTDLDTTNSVTGTGLVSGTTIQGPSAARTGRVVTVVQGGTLAASIDSSGAASSQFYTAGLTGLEMARLKLAATVENMKVQRLELRTLNGTSNIANIKLLGTGLSSDPTTPLTTGTAVFTFAAGSEVTVPAYGTRVLTAVVDTTSAGTLVAGNLGVLGLETMNVIGAGSGLTVQESVTGTVYTVANSAQFTGGTPAAAVGDVVYFTATAAAGTNTAPGFYMVTTINNTNLTTAGSLALNSGATGTSFAVGDVVTRLTRAETIAGNGGNTTTAWNVGDLVYVRDNDGTGAGLGSGFAVVTTAVASGANINTGVFSPIIGDITAVTAATHQITRFTNSNGLVGNTMRYEEVEPTITLASGNPSGTQSPGSEQTIAVFAIKAAGQRDLTWNSLTVEKSGSNTPEAFVTDFSLYDGTTRIARVASTTVSGSTGAGATNADTTLVLCGGSTTTTVGEIAGITAAERDTLAIGDRVTVVSTTTNTLPTITAITGTYTTTCGGNSTYTLTFDATVTIEASTTVTFRNTRVHFDANQANTSDVALASQTITAGQTQTVTVKAATTSVRSGAGTAAVTFGIIIPGVAGPLQVATTQVEGLQWLYRSLRTDADVAARTEADGYPINANTLTY